MVNWAESSLHLDCDLPQRARSPLTLNEKRAAPYLGGSSHVSSAIANSTVVTGKGEAAILHRIPVGWHLLSCEGEAQKGWGTHRSWHRDTRQAQNQTRSLTQGSLGYVSGKSTKQSTGPPRKTKTHKHRKSRQPVPKLGGRGAPSQIRLLKSELNFSLCDNDSDGRGGWARGKLVCRFAGHPWKPCGRRTKALLPAGLLSFWRIINKYFLLAYNQQLNQTIM